MIRILQANSINRLTTEKIEKIYRQEIEEYEEVVSKIMSYSEEDVDFLATEERAMPSNEEFQEVDYHLKMLGRYFFAGKVFCKRKTVLDSCSGVGWGTYILSNYAKKITAFDLEEKAIEFSQKTWKSENIEWIAGNALDEKLLRDEKFDVVTAMETIEHFSKEDGDKYIYICSERLKKGGHLVGTSAFPLTVEDAEALRQTNPYHPHIFTLEEISTILSKYFSKFKIIDNWMFIAQK